MPRCVRCRNTRKCFVCDGLGKTMSLSGTNRKIDCPMCGGSGKCKGCKSEQLVVADPVSVAQAEAPTSQVIACQ
jgi:primosomal protein N'